MIPTETTSLVFSQSTVESGEESFGSNKDTATNATKRIDRITSSNAFAERREALSEQGVGKAAFLVKDAVIGIRWVKDTMLQLLRCRDLNELSNCCQGCTVRGVL